MHAALELVDIDFFFNGAEEVGEILVSVTDIPAFVSEALASVIDPGELLLKLLGVQFPSGFDGGGRKNNGVGERSGRVSEGGAKEPKVTKTTGAVHEQGRVITGWKECLCRVRSLCHGWRLGYLGQR